MIMAFMALLVCQLAGEILVRGMRIPVPGPVLGMVFLFLLLLARRFVPVGLPREFEDGTLESSAKTLLSHLSLLFVPAAVGVIQRLDVLGNHAVVLSVVLVVSTVLGLVASALAFQYAARWLGQESAEEGEDK